MPPGSPLDILVVDDDDALRNMLTRSFEREGHRITSVADGHGALEEASRGHFDVILLDVALGPGPTGYDIARAPRARQPPGRRASGGRQRRAGSAPARGLGRRQAGAADLRGVRAAAVPDD